MKKFKNDVIFLAQKSYTSIYNAKNVYTKLKWQRNIINYMNITSCIHICKYISIYYSSTYQQISTISSKIIDFFIVLDVWVQVTLWLGRNITIMHHKKYMEYKYKLLKNSFFTYKIIKINFSTFHIYYMYRRNN